MLTDRLRQVVERLGDLPEQEQDRFAVWLAAEMDEDARWQSAMDDRHDLVLDRLLSEAREQVAQGEARDLDELF